MKLIDKKTVAEMLEVCPRQINRLMEQRQLPFSRRGRVVRFNPVEIEAVIASWRVPAVNEPRPPKRRALRLTEIEA
jgi:predicted DNA-binding transcriptional regulator AlpA